MDRIKAKKLNDYLRLAIQLVFLIVLPSAFASAFTAVKEVFTAFSTGAELSFTPFAKICVFLLAFTVIFGRFFCGYACAFGTIGDLVYKVSTFVQKKSGKKIKVMPKDVVKYAQCVKYAVLAGIAALCAFGKGGLVSENSPWTLFSLMLKGKFPIATYTAAFVLLVLIVCGMAIRERFFCQFLCPMGALFSLMPVLPTGALKRDSEKCIHGCSICERGCPVTIKLGDDDLRSGECIRCNKCMNYCPRGSITDGVSVISTSSPAGVIIQAAILFLVLKFVI